MHNSTRGWTWLCAVEPGATHADESAHATSTCVARATTAAARRHHQPDPRMSALDAVHDLPPGVAPLEGPPPPRCWPETDAIATDGEKHGARYICLSWARGDCPLGARCGERHRLPSLDDEQRMTFAADRDIFGRAGARQALLCQTVRVCGLPAVLDTATERRSALQVLSEWGSDLVKTWHVADPLSLIHI